jgi:hypothetical protein
MNLWTELITTAVVGTARQALPALSAGQSLTALLSQLDQADREGALLHAAALAALYESAGRLPAIESAPKPEPAPAETLPRCPTRVALRLKLLLEGHYAELLPELLTVLARTGQRVPEELLTALLERGRGKEELLALLPPVLGARGLWLARQHSAWQYILNQTEDEAVWETGTLAQRKAWLRRLRERDPARARELLQAVWEQEPAAARAALLEQLEHNLSTSDEPFLQALAESKARQNWVTLAQSLLARLPESALVQRAIEQAWPALELKTGGLLRKETFTSELDHDDLSKLLTAVPPSTWSRKWNKSPAELIALANGSKLRVPLLNAWLAAAARFGEVAWAAELIVEAPQRGDELWRVLSSAQQQAVLLRLLQKHPTLLYDAPATPYLARCYGTWTSELSQVVLDVLRRHLQRDELAQAWAWRSTLNAIATQLAPASLAAVLTEMSKLLAPTAASFDAVNEFLTLLQFRHDMLQEVQP